MTRWKDEPFALIGVNAAGSDTKALKEAMQKESLPWRSFADPGAAGQGAIATRWNLSRLPTLYVIDPRGVIRHKWAGNPGEEAIDAALERLIREAAGGK